MFPDVSLAVDTFADTVSFTVVKKTIIDFEVSESTTEPIYFDGVVEPLHGKDLLVKPEGERDWNWVTLWTDQSLETDWIVQDQNCVQYRVVKKKDWSGGGYREYELAENVRKIT